MKLRLDQWANVAEIVGAVAVVISLLYVGIQINDSASAVRAASANDANVALQAWYIQAGASSNTSSLLYRGLVSEKALADEEEFQFLMMMHGVFLGFQNSFLLAAEGTIDDEFLSSLTTTIGGINQLPGMKRYWKQRRSYLHPGFTDWVDRLSAQDIEVTMDLYKNPGNKSADTAPD